MRAVAEKVVATREPVSILLFGEPGTGKTEFARLLASRVGRGALFAGLSDDQGMEPDRSERLDHLMLLRALCRNQPTNVIVVDEADDVLVLSERKGSSKQWINRLVEDPRVTTIWIVNRRTRLDPFAAVGGDHPQREDDFLLSTFSRPAFQAFFGSIGGQQMQAEDKYSSRPHSSREATPSPP